MMKINSRVYRNLGEYVSQRDNIILKLCSNKTVFHLGACDAPYTKEKIGNGTLLHTKIDKVAKGVVGIDNDRKTIALLKSRGYQMQFCDINKSVPKIALQPEIIVCGEFIEHITNFDKLFQFFDEYSKNKSPKIIITTPNCYFGLYFVFNLFGFEVINGDHKTCFSMGSLRQLVETKGYYVQKSYYTNLNKTKNSDRLILKLYRLFLPLIPQTAETLCVVIQKGR